MELLCCTMDELVCLRLWIFASDLVGECTELGLWLPHLSMKEVYIQPSGSSSRASWCFSLQKASSHISWQTGWHHCSICQLQDPSTSLPWSSQELHNKDFHMLFSVFLHGYISYLIRNPLFWCSYYGRVTNSQAWDLCAQFQAYGCTQYLTQSIGTSLLPLPPWAFYSWQCVERALLHCNTPLSDTNNRCSQSFHITELHGGVLLSSRWWSHGWFDRYHPGLWSCPSLGSLSPLYHQ